MKNSILRNFVMLALMAMASCVTKKEIHETVVDVQTWPDLEDIKSDTLHIKRAEASFYGAYSQTVDRWYLTLFTGNAAEYDLATDTYTGDGKMVKLCLQTPISDGKEKDFGVMARKYTCPDSYSELQIGQWETGYDYMYDHPYFGHLYASYGSYFADLDKSQYSPLMFIDGEFEILQGGKEGEFVVKGVLVDGTFTKRTFVYEGAFTQVADFEFAGAPDSVLKGDISLSRSELPKIDIRDRGDQYRYENPPRFSNHKVFLTEDGVTVAPTTRKTDPIKFQGQGKVLMLDLFVNPDANGRIPEGSYQIVNRLENYGIDGSDIWPFKFLEGYPHRYSEPQGCWYFCVDGNGHWKGDYARIKTGTLEVSYAAGSDSPIIKAEFLDCNTPAHKITLNWK